MSIFLKWLKAKKRNEIRNGKLWEITRLWGWDIRKVERQPAQPEPFKKPAGGKVDEIRIHIFKAEDNVTNLTKNPELL